jgi:hypothetical protein
MPWKDCSAMDERLQFVERRLGSEPQPLSPNGFPRFESIAMI